MAIYEAKGIDIVLVKAGVGSTLNSHLAESMGKKILAVPGVKEVAGTLFDTVAFKHTSLSSVLVNGWEPGTMMFKGIHVLQGRTFAREDGRAVMLGRVLAVTLKKTVGDDVDLSDETFQVVGIYESSSLFENGGLILPMRELQRRMDRADRVSGFVISAVSSKSADVRALATRLEQALPGVAASPARDFVEGENQIRLVKAMAWATSAIAMVLGSVGVLNTMMMTVFERTKEIGILRALGWKRSRVMSLVLGEAAMLGLAGALLGSVMAFLSVKALAQFPMTAIFINPNLPPAVLGLGMALGVGLSLFGGLYPAIRASSLDPTEALRHE